MRAIHDRCFSNFWEFGSFFRSNCFYRLLKFRGWDKSDFYFCFILFLSDNLNGFFTTLSMVFKELTFNNKSKNLKIWKAISRFSSLLLRSKRSFHNLYPRCSKACIFNNKPKQMKNMKSCFSLFILIAWCRPAFSQPLSAVFKSQLLEISMNFSKHGELFRKIHTYCRRSWTAFSQPSIKTKQYRWKV